MVNKKQKKDVKSSDEPLFTMAEVRAFVEKAVQQEQIRIREEYDKILLERLNEQFSMFSKYTEDHISRQLKMSDFNYMS